jgi:hypothetical protein
MMAHGWIYVLVNSSIPGLNKVGRTDRSSQLRVAELSAATGVATPFVLAFQQEFPDSRLAERAVHAELDRRRLRVSPNREFFRGEPAEIIRVVLQVANDTGRPSPADIGRSAADLLDEGDRYFSGDGGVAKDLRRAIECWRVAAYQGSILAPERLGTFYSNYQIGGEVDRCRAQDHLNQGLRLGNYYCYIPLAALHARDGRCAEFSTAWSLFFRARRDAFCPEAEAGNQRFPRALSRYVRDCLAFGLAPQHRRELSNNAVGLFAELSAQLEAAPCEHTALALRWCYQNLAPCRPPAAKPPLAQRLRAWFPRQRPNAA